MSEEDSIVHQPVTRRRALQAAGLALAGSSLAGLPGCGSSSSTASSTAPATPKKGGTLTVGFSGGGGTDTLDPNAWVSLVDGARVYQLYDSLVTFDSNAQPQMSLAAEITPNAKATEWTIRLQKGIRLHDGTPLTADDVIFTLNRIVNPKSPLSGATSLPGLDAAGMKKIDELTARVPFHSAFAVLPEVLACYEFFIVPTGFNAKHPIGTGPFKYKSFTPGQQSVFVRNDDYWMSGLPYLSELIITDYSDETAQLNALQGGQAQAVGVLSAASIGTLQGSGSHVLLSAGGFFQPFTMQMHHAPFNDVRVRQAFRLLVDREEMLRQVFAGHGTIGNDLFGIWDPAYNHSLPQRVADAEQAKSLLKQAGHDGLTVELITSDFASGLVQSAQVLAQQASAAGVKVNLRQITPTELYGPNYKSWTFAQDAWDYYPYIPDVLQGMVPNAPFNECGAGDPAYLRLLKQALAELNPTKRADIIHEMQQREYDGVSSGYIIPYFPATIDGYATKVNGLHSSRTGLPLGGYELKRVWLS